MRGPRVKTPLLLLLLLLTGTEVHSTVSETTTAPELHTTVTVEKNIEEEQGSGQERSLNGAEENQGTVEEKNNPTSLTPTPKGEGSGDSASEKDEGNLNFIIILIPMVLVVVIIGIIVCGIFINRRWNKKGRNQELKQEDPYLDGSSTEKVPMPMFEEDVPSVLELEMEELDQWMKEDGRNIMVKAAGYLDQYHDKKRGKREADKCFTITVADPVSCLFWISLPPSTLTAPGSVGGSASLQRGRSAELQITRRTPKHRQAFPEPLRSPSTDSASLAAVSIALKESTLRAGPGVEKTNCGLNKDRKRE
ncbi:hypothetical protein L3Q82_019852, partial [Scortum barcoo]